VQRPSAAKGSIGQLEDYARDDVKTFKFHVIEVTQISAKLEELKRMLDSGELSENMYRMVRMS